MSWYYWLKYELNINKTWLFTAIRRFLVISKLKHLQTQSINIARNRFKLLWRSKVRKTFPFLFSHFIFFFSLNLFKDELCLCCETLVFGHKTQCSTVPEPPGPPLTMSMSQMSSWAFLSFFFFFLEGSSGGFSRDSSSDLLMSENRRRCEGAGRECHFRWINDEIIPTAAGTKRLCSQEGQRNSLSAWQISATALNTTLEKQTSILMVFMLGSCSSSDLCCGVKRRSASDCGERTF